MSNSRRRVIIIPIGAILTLITMAAFFLGNTVGPKRKIGAYVHADKLIASDLSESQKQYVYTYFTGELEKVYETNIDDVPYVCAQVKERDRTWTVIIGESGRYKGDVLKDHIGETYKCRNISPLSPPPCICNSLFSMLFLETLTPRGRVPRTE